MRGILKVLRSLVAAPRFLSCVELEDFLVVAEDGVHLGIALCPTGPLLRVETPLSDFEIAKKWTEESAKLHGFLKEGGRTSLREVEGKQTRAFSRRLQKLKFGRERSLEERFLDLEAVFSKDFGHAVATQTNSGHPLSSGTKPLGVLSELLSDRYRKAQPEESFLTSGSTEDAIPASPFLLNLSSGRKAVLLPPERWFEGSSPVEAVNRKMSHPFLKAHHNSVRIRSLYCDDAVTALICDPGTSLSLPSLLRIRGGFSPRDSLLLAGKLHRALAHFESAGFEFSPSTPWQAEVHLQGGVANSKRHPFFHREMVDWPPWDIKWRVERPSESMVHSDSGLVWNWVMDRLSGKFFPSLMAWMLDWRRFAEAARTGSLNQQRLHLDEGIEALLLAAGEHFSPGNASHRAKFLSLASEGLGVDSRGNPPARKGIA